MADLSYKFSGVNTAQLAYEVQCQRTDHGPTASSDLQYRRAAGSTVVTSRRTAGRNLQRPADVAISASAVVLAPSGR